MREIDKNREKNRLMWEKRRKRWAEWKAQQATQKQIPYPAFRVQEFDVAMKGK